jgi:hypothetical protein
LWDDQGRTAARCDFGDEDEYEEAARQMAEAVLDAGEDVCPPVPGADQLGSPERLAMLAEVRETAEKYQGRISMEPCDSEGLGLVDISLSEFSEAVQHGDSFRIRLVNAAGFAPIPPPQGYSINFMSDGYDLGTEWEVKEWKLYDTQLSVQLRSKDVRIDR